MRPENGHEGALDPSCPKFHRSELAAEAGFSVRVRANKRAPEPRGLQAVVSLALPPSPPPQRVLFVEKGQSLARPVLEWTPLLQSTRALIGTQ